MTADSDIDRAIMQMVMDRWRKTAMVLAKTEEALRKAGVQVSWDDIAGRLEALDADIESQGDLTLWRNSEVRLPQVNAEER
ncbi:MAG: hypothetical protein EOS65_28885 [Mesorhizobium sp.]|uniref:hypothetical protein n=1 Tax=Mesorhizobium sp. TaxID=1871066 RepID=UPI000FE9EAA4|nr:hypothetical protein [Mesorhizobium sp.]RWF27627.1 MAG: hypothetical protein EOS45_25410 [Mesorhizobium sp.]RWF36233.1 MAG: hypothetical protein EOS65_28885 [Mesorhizobium sp.]TIX10472.1 MAG: hypothetical protein E5V41_29090 [Mesorhizobium sp.]TIX34942.1 MAG: hypothetical protein E5V40_27835 [Mesorhizobium sp.]TJW01591.1 MAG: hypothetical protein E5W97_25520 [Mesorhizobium sp.]